MPVTLLLADDSATIQRVIEMTFAGEDVRVVTVDDGREAIERIAADPPDIVLADTGMPEKDGYDVSAFVKADGALSHIPVVLLTGAFDPVDDERAREAGCDAVLVKPFEPNAVISRVRELLGAPADARAGAPEGEAASSTPAPEDGAADDGPEPAGQGAAIEASTPAPEAAPAAAGAGAGARESDAAAAEAGTADGPPLPAEPVVADSAAPEPRPAAAAPAVPAPAVPEAGDAASAGAESPAPTGGAAAVPPPAVPAVEAPSPPTLADAFASLLAAEQGDLDRARAAYPWPRQAGPTDDEELIDRVAERVIERLSEDVTGELVSDVVARVAERLVRDQIGRIEPA